MKSNNWKFFKRLVNQIRTLNQIFSFLLFFPGILIRKESLLNYDLPLEVLGFEVQAVSRSQKLLTWSRVHHSNKLSTPCCLRKGKLLRSKRSLKPSIMCTYSLLFNYFILRLGGDYCSINWSGSFGYQDLLKCRWVKLD